MSSTIEKCRKCFGTMRQVDRSKNLWRCDGCERCFVRLADGIDGRFFEADASGRVLGGDGLSTRVEGNTSTRGWIYADGRPADQDLQISAPPSTAGRDDGANSPSGSQRAPLAAGVPSLEFSPRFKAGIAEIVRQHLQDCRICNFDDPASVAALEALNTTRIARLLSEQSPYASNV